jgi:hypothetical protein
VTTKYAKDTKREAIADRVDFPVEKRNPLDALQSVTKRKRLKKKRKDAKSEGRDENSLEANERIEEARLIRLPLVLARV